MFEGHQGPVTGISCHKAMGPVDFTDLFTTSSFDWSAKLWSTKVRVFNLSILSNIGVVYKDSGSSVVKALGY